VLKVKFTHSNTVRDKKPYTIYEIEVRSSSTITWVIYKRYSHFHQLHTELTKANTLTLEQRNNLPLLPPKRLTRSLAVEFVEKRKHELQDYLRALLETPGLVHNPIMLAFLQVPDSVRPMLAAANTGRELEGAGGHSQVGSAGGDVGVNEYGHDLSGASNAPSSSSMRHGAPKSAEERRILDLLNLLKYHPNKVAALKSFEEWFFEERPRLSSECIRMLLMGRGGGEQDGGLLQTCGNLTYSHVSSRAALYLLCRLLDVERNKEAPAFLDQFARLDVEHLRRMQLKQHILSERGNRIGAFKIIHILRNTHVAATAPPHSSMGGGNGGVVGMERVLEAVVGDAWALREYYKWAERQSNSSGQIVPFNNYETQNKDSIVMKSLTLASGSGGEGGGGPSSIDDAALIRDIRCKISDIFQDMKRLMEEEEKFVGGIADGAPTTSASNSASNSATSSNLWRLVPVPPCSSFVSCACCVPGWDLDVSLCYRKNVKQDMVIVKMQCILPYTMEEVAPYLADLHLRKEFDAKFHKGKCLEQRASQEYIYVPASALSPSSASTNGDGTQDVEASSPATLNTPTNAPSTSPSPSPSSNLRPLSLSYPAYHTDIVHMTFKSSASPYKYRDMVVLRSFARIDMTREEWEKEAERRRRLAGQIAQTDTDASTNATGAGPATAPSASPSSTASNVSSPSTIPSSSAPPSSSAQCERPVYAESIFSLGGMIFGTRSVIHPAGPETKDNRRAVLYPTGYVLRPLDKQEVKRHSRNDNPSQTRTTPSSTSPVSSSSSVYSSCELTFLSQMDREGVLSVSPDLLGETNELRQTFINLKQLLARDCGLRTLMQSEHTERLRAKAGWSSTCTNTEANGEVRQSGVMDGGVPFPNHAAITPSLVANASRSGAASPSASDSDGDNVNVNRPSSATHSPARLTRANPAHANAGPLPAIPEKR